MDPINTKNVAIMQITSEITHAGMIVLYGVDRNGQVYKCVPGTLPLGWTPLPMNVLPLRSN